MGRTKTKTLEERQAFVRAVQANLERTGRKDIAGICRTHPGWKERTVAFYYRKFELAKSLHGAPRRGATDQAQLDDLAAQLEPDVLGKVLATLSSTRPAARLLGISKSAMQRRKGPLVRAVQRQQQQRPKDEFWYSRDPDALEKELHHLRKCCLDEKSLDLVMFLASEDNLCSLIVEAHNLHCTRMRLVIDEAQAKRRRNRQWLREFKGAGIPVKTGRTASTMVHNKWGIINGKFVLEGTGNFGVDAFTSKHAESYGTRWDEAAVTSRQQEFDALWREGRTLVSVPKTGPCLFTLLGTSDEE